VKKLEDWSIETGLKGLSFDSNYQLNIEDADAIAEKDIVIFADASTEEIEDFILTEVTGERDVSFTTHAASPGYIVKLCGEIFNKFPKVYLLHIKGYQWEFKEGLSDRAESNLRRAVDFIKEYLVNLQNQNSRT